MAILLIKRAATEQAFRITLGTFVRSISILFSELLLNVLRVETVLDPPGSCRHDRAVVSQLCLSPSAGHSTTIVILSAHDSSREISRGPGLRPVYETLAATPPERVDLDLKPRRFP